MSETVVDDILAYECTVGMQKAGSLSPTVLAAIANLAPRPLLLSVETGCGKSTVLLSNLSERHLCFTLDDTVWYPPGDIRASLTFVRRCPSFRSDRTQFILGPTQRTVPTYKFDQPVDLALIDGPHAFPFPSMEYCHLYPHLRPGALLIIDDINIPTIGWLFDFVCEDKMFDLIDVEGFTAFLQRSDAPTFSSEGDGWELQDFNASRVSKGLENQNVKIWQLESQITTQEAQITTLEAEITTQEAQIASLETRLAERNAQITTQETQITTLEAQIATQEAQIASLETRLAECNGALNDALVKLNVLKRSRLLKLGRMLRRLTRQEVPY